MARELSDLNSPQPLQIRFGADKAAHKVAGRMRQNMVRRRELRQLAALTEDSDSIAKANSFIDIMGHRDDRFAQALLQQQQLVLQALANDRVDSGKRFVHQENRRIGGQRSGDRHAPLLAAGKLVRIAGQDVAVERHQIH